MKNLPNIGVEKVRYGYILVDDKGYSVEPLTRFLNVPYYKTAETAQKKADSLNFILEQSK